MSDTQERIAYLEQKIESSKLILLQYLQVIYTKGDGVFSSDDSSVDLLKTLVMNEADAARVLDDMYSQVLLELAGKEFIDGYRTLVSQRYQEQANLIEQKSKLEQSQKDLEIFQIELE